MAKSSIFDEIFDEMRFLMNEKKKEIFGEKILLSPVMVQVL